MSNVDMSLEYRDLSIHATNPFAAFNSSPRLSMYASHISQALVLEESDIPYILTGAEKRLGELAKDIVMPEDAIVEAVIYRNAKASVTKGYIECVIIYYGLESKTIDVLTVPIFDRNHQYFGYPLISVDVLPTVGDTVAKGKLLAQTPNKNNKGLGESWYGFGKNLNTAFMDMPAVSEDGFIICEDVLDKLAFYTYEDRVIDIDARAEDIEGYPTANIPLNLYGDNNTYKTFPDIGEMVNPDAIVFGMRRVHLSRYSAGTRMDRLRTVETKTDKLVYARNNTGVVVDAQVIKRPSLGISRLPIHHQLESYAEDYKRFYKDILVAETNIFRKYQNKGINTNIYSPRFLALLEKARIITATPLNQKSRGYKEKSIKYTYQKDSVGDYRLTLTIQHRLVPGIGSKLTDRAGGKGVIVEIRKPEEMPIDEYGVRADIIVDKNSIISRMNPGRFYEQAYNYCLMHSSRRTREVLNLGQQTTIDSASEENKQKAVEYLANLFSIVSPKQKDVFLSSTKEEQEEYLQTVIDDGIYLFKEIGYKEDPVEVMKTLMNNPDYYPKKTKVRWIGADGKLKESRNPIMIAPTYIMLLEKIGDSGMVVSSPRTNHIGVFVKTPSSQKALYPVRLNPVRIIGESESRILLAYGGQEAAAEIMDQGSAPDTHKAIYRAFLESEKPTQLYRAVDRDKVPLGNTIPIRILDHIYECQGIRDYFIKTGE